MSKKHVHPKWEKTEAEQHYIMCAFKDRVVNRFEERNWQVKDVIDLVQDSGLLTQVCDWTGTKVCPQRLGVYLKKQAGSVYNAHKLVMDDPKNSKNSFHFELLDMNEMLDGDHNQSRERLLSDLDYSHNKEYREKYKVIKDGLKFGPSKVTIGYCGTSNQFIVTNNRQNVIGHGLNLVDAIYYYLIERNRTDNKRLDDLVSKQKNISDNRDEKYRKFQ